MFCSFNYCTQPLTTLTIIFTLCRILIQDPITFAQGGHTRKNAEPVAIIHMEFLLLAKFLSELG